jgi:RNA polymerase sigma-70 factor (ECF subfamily)
MELAELINTLQHKHIGYEKAFESIVELFKNRVFTVCYRMINEYDDASDISQDVFMEVYIKIADLKDSGKFLSWIYRIAINKCLNFLKKKTNSVLNNVDSSVSYNKKNEIENKDMVNYLLSQLAPNYRTVLILFYIEDRSIQEITEILDVSESAVKMRLKRARDYLKKVEELEKW